MLYDAYEVQRSLMASASRLAGLGAGWLNNPANPLSYSSMSPLVAAGLDVFAHASASRGKPEFGIETVRVGKREVAVDDQLERVGHARRGGGGDDQGCGGTGEMSRVTPRMIPHHRQAGQALGFFVVGEGGHCSHP